MSDNDSGAADSGHEDGGYAPFRMTGPSVPHYYGDYVRQFFLGASALMLFSAPFYADNLKAELPFEVAGALILVSLGALTNPWKPLIMTANAIAAGIGVAVYQSWALVGYDANDLVPFVLRQAIAFAFLFAFYFAVKTCRCMMLGQVGKRATFGEFEDRNQTRIKTELSEGDGD
jgi:hypothetical protein